MSIKKSNIERLLSAFNHVKLDRVPNFEIWLNPHILSYLTGTRTDKNLWEIEPSFAVKAACAVGQDAIPCPLHLTLPKGSICKHTDIDKIIVPDPHIARIKLIKYLEATKGTNVGVAVCISAPLTPAYVTCGPVPIESFMYLLYDDPYLIERVMDLYLNYYLNVIEIIYDLPFHFFYIGDDIAYNKGPIISPALLEEYWVPRAAKLVKAAKDTKKPVMFHCCGDQSVILPYLIEWGVNAVHPIQPQANDIYDIYKEYGKKIALVGNIDVSEVLSMGSVDEVRKDTLLHIEKLSGYGGYVVSSSHSIIDTVPTENYIAMVETVHNYGVY